MHNAKTHIKVNDRVEVIAGGDKGRVGKVIRIDRKRGRAVVDKINMIKRHTKPSAQNQQGGILDKEAPVAISNLMLICPKCAKTSRVGRRVLDDASRERFCKKCGESVEVPA
ncbi:50S ribosomal protein L24 [Desulfurivibrio dismutans]|uniref:50S ribosomal protein L24 n=1 Tax=Desulfurivibrio dismutans TaxID=1398908 RepID=UPI0023DB4446|nr:50S ribosomal protein L24 [Desulfurivibrio alkaliphilus]MDF1613468.1 50S ribosomal protein L24 [Desulfurivibrio alkaliphilus]